MLPKLIHPIDITIERWDLTNTSYDEDMREPIKQTKKLVKLIVKGQPRWTEKDKVLINEGGTILESRGYILFRYIDLNSQSISLKRQDRITKMGHLDTDVYIISFRPTVHYPNQNGPAMVKAYFTDRSPSRG